MRPLPEVASPLQPPEADRQLGRAPGDGSPSVGSDDVRDAAGASAGAAGGGGGGPPVDPFGVVPGSSSVPIRSGDVPGPAASTDASDR